MLYHTLSLPALTLISPGLAWSEPMSDMRSPMMHDDNWSHLRRHMWYLKGIHAVAWLLTNLTIGCCEPTDDSSSDNKQHAWSQKPSGLIMHGMHIGADTLWCLKGVHNQSPPSGWGLLTQAFPSANHLVGTVQSSVSILHPLAGPKAAQVLHRGIADLFQAYTNALSTGFQKHQQPDGSFPYNLGTGLCSQCTSDALATT